MSCFPVVKEVLIWHILKYDIISFILRYENKRKLWHVVDSASKVSPYILIYYLLLIY